MPRGILTILGSIPVILFGVGFWGLWIGYAAFVFGIMAALLVLVRLARLGAFVLGVSLLVIGGFFVDVTTGGYVGTGGGRIFYGLVGVLGLFAAIAGAGICLAMILGRNRSVQETSQSQP